MFNHTTPPSSGSDHNEQAAESPNSRRFADQRGIALQTIIIMVVLLAIAGTVAAVLLSRAGEETSNLEDSTSSTAYGVTNASGCALGGHTWDDGSGTPSADDVKALNIARPGEGNGTNGVWTAAAAAPAYCKPTP